MSDLPPPFTIPAYSTSDHSTKIKLRVPHAAQAQHPPTNPNPSGGTLMLRVPPHATPAATTPQLPNSNAINVNPGKSPKVTPKVKVTPLVPETVHPTPPPATAQPTVHHAVTTTAAQASQSQPATFTQPAYTSTYASAHYPNALYQQASQQARTPTTLPAALPNTTNLQQSTRHQSSTPVPTQVLNLTAQAPTTAHPTQPIAPRPPPAVTVPVIPLIAPTTTTTPAMGTATVQIGRAHV